MENHKDIMAIVKAARDFITIDDEIHSTPEEEDYTIIRNRAESYTNARRKLLLLIKPIEKK